MNMREQENIDLVKRLRTRQPYKHALEIMADDLTQWLRDESVHDGDIFEHSIILGQGDYPSGRDIIGNAVRKMNEAADAIESLQARVKELDTTISNLRKVNEQYLKNSNENFHAANTARRDAFEEAARVADMWATDLQRQFGNGGPAAAIRALAEKG